MTEQNQPPSGQRQDPAEPKRVDTAQQTAPQPAAVTPDAPQESKSSEEKTDAYAGYSVVAGRPVEGRGDNNEDLSSVPDES